LSPLTPLAPPNRCIVQVYAYFSITDWKSEGDRTKALVSILISALTAGFISASISYDLE
jgi:hypothetical protein